MTTVCLCLWCEKQNYVLYYNKIIYNKKFVMKRMKNLIFISVLFLTANITAQSVSSYGALSTSTEIAQKLQAYESDNISKNVINPNDFLNVNHSGDLSLNIPLYTVKGRKLSFPIIANYSAGIKVDQKSSEIGLGWNINFGSIVRDYGAFEPDYTSTRLEVKAEHTDIDLQDGFLSVNSNPNNTTNHKSIIYNGVNDASGLMENKMTPDDYIVNIPGLGGNTFWNGGTYSESHDFKFDDYTNWKLDFGTVQYVFDQEFSRVNEVALDGQSIISIADIDDAIGKGRGFAASTCLPPHAKQKHFTRTSSTALANAENNFNGFNDQANKKIKYEDFENFIITDESGTQYVFGRALRGQKYLLSDDPFWSTLENERQFEGSFGKKIFGEFWKIDYIAEWGSVALI